MLRQCELIKKSNNLTSRIDFNIEVFMEKIPDNGEDSYLYSLNENSALIGVFDGCGGSGAQKYESYKGRTGAYMASRVASGATRDWFCENNLDVGLLKSKINTYLNLCQNVGGNENSLIISKIFKKFPTTAAIILVRSNNEDVEATCIWAGDSRCYLLDADGLKQLTEDDLDVTDPMENLTADGIIANAISLSKDYILHSKSITISRPTFLFTATDGCFDYFSTPMEFENLLLKTLQSSVNVISWEDKIDGILQETAGDDYSLSGVSIDFGSFEAMKSALKNRYTYLYGKYINGLNEKTREEKVDLWKMYKSDYLIHIAD